MKISLKQGVLQGTKNISRLSEKPYYSFLRIPYAQPPINLLRFQAPQPHYGWSGILDATQNTTRCPQLDQYMSPPFAGEEDCLYLNVHTPEDPHLVKKPKPVMVFVHGGGFCWGAGNMYRADYLMNYDVILVTFNYRLNVFGFLNLDLPECPGNVGLKDQMMAFSWVRENISKFGGDPSNITAIGESAGAASIHYLMICPASQGLFDKAILQSGSALCPWAFAEKKLKCAFQLGRILGCHTTDKNELLNFLLEVAVDDLVYAHSSLLKELSNNELIRLAFAPSIEERQGPGILLPDNPRNLLKNTMKIPIISGINDLEGLVFLLNKSLPKLMWLNENLNVIPNDILALVDCFPSIVEKVKKFYFGDDNIREDTLSQFVDLLSDVGFTNDFYNVSRHLLENGSEPPAFFYKFSYESPYNVLKQLALMQFPDFNRKGPCHADELFFLFVVDMNVEVFCEGEERIINSMCSSWTNFAKFGNPATESFPWMPATLQQPCYLSITGNPELKMGFIDERRINFWHKLRRELRLVNDFTDSKM